MGEVRMIYPREMSGGELSPIDKNFIEIVRERTGAKIPRVLKTANSDGGSGKFRVWSQPGDRDSLDLVHMIIGIYRREYEREGRARPSGFLTQVILHSRLCVAGVCFRGDSVVCNCDGKFSPVIRTSTEFGEVILNKSDIRHAEYYYQLSNELILAEKMRRNYDTYNN